MWWKLLQPLCWRCLKFVVSHEHLLIEIPAFVWCLLDCIYQSLSIPSLENHDIIVELQPFWTLHRCIFRGFLIFLQPDHMSLYGLCNVMGLVFEFSSYDWDLFHASFYLLNFEDLFCELNLYLIYFTPKQEGMLFQRHYIHLSFIGCLQQYFEGTILGF